MLETGHRDRDTLLSGPLGSLGMQDSDSLAIVLATGYHVLAVFSSFVSSMVLFLRTYLILLITYTSKQNK